MSEKELVVGMRNKRGRFRKVKWMPGYVMISKEGYDEYQKLKKLKAAIDMGKRLRANFPEVPIMFKLSPDSDLELE